jgi:phosphate transport system ATP-binding protein
MIVMQTNTAIDGETAFQVENVSVYYGSFPALQSVYLEIPKHRITAFIGSSGCGKSTLLRCFNRLNDFIPGARVEGEIRFHGTNLYEKSVDPVEIRRRIGMVFQAPNPFPKSIYENIAYGIRINGYQGDVDELVEAALKAAALWDEVKDKDSGLSLSGGQQQRLCIARALAIEPEVLLMDEPCSALDPISTGRIEQLLDELKQKYTIVIVTHNMQQAARISSYTAFFSTDESRVGQMIEFGATAQIFGEAVDPRTRDYVEGRFG